MSDGRDERLLPIPRAAVHSVLQVHRVVSLDEALHHRDSEVSFDPNLPAPDSTLLLRFDLFPSRRPSLTKFKSIKRLGDKGNGLTQSSRTIL
jgi:hypothetical protein